MQLQTLILGGIEYVLVPKEYFDKVIPLKDQSRDIVLDPQPLPLATEEEKKDSIRIVENPLEGTVKATPKKSQYREKFLAKKLTPFDIVAIQRNNPAADFVEIPEISVNDSGLKPPAGRAGFYGPGIENDSGI